MHNVVGPTLVAMATKVGLICAIFCTKSHISRLLRQIDRRCLGLTRGRPGWPTLVAMATKFGLGAESSRLPSCLVINVKYDITNNVSNTHKMCVISRLLYS